MELKILYGTEDKSKEMYASPDCQQLIDPMKEYYQEIGFNIPWVGYFVIKNEQVVGTASFTGKPKNGKVEMAYWTFKAFEGQGIASFACEELLKIAQNEDPTIRITAKTAPEENASTKILKKNGFVFTKKVQDEDIGDAWLWEKAG